MKLNPTTLASTILVLALLLVAGLVKLASPSRTVTRIEHQQQMQQAELKQRFEQGVVMLHAKQYDHAITALHRVLELAPRLPEAHVNMGYALLGLEKPDAAIGFFTAAIELKPDQANAYFGLALASEARQDYGMALGAMRSYLHLSRDADEKHRARARAALWEWEQKLGRLPPSPQPGQAQPHAQARGQAPGGGQRQ